ncbi:MAG: TlpA family protein disulfide reductase [Dethiobacter sp.]|jgi:peroxiredoxin|nr:TlpA family protein disulfide reductase [Dethiobacter sp.]
MNRRKLLLILLAIVLIPALTVGGILLLDKSPGSSETGSGPQAGNTAPDFTIPDALTGQNVSLSDFRGKAVLLNFWSTWCSACRAQKPDLIDAYFDFADQGLIILGVNLGESAQVVREYANQQGIPYALLLDTEQKVADLYQVRGIPTTFLIDGQGVIREVRIGLFNNAADLAAGIEKIIEAPEPEQRRL